MTTKSFILTSNTQRNFLCDVRFQTSSRTKPVIVFVHGFKGFKDWGHFPLLADELAKNGYVVTRLNFSHNGTTPEHPVDFVDLEAFGQNNFSIEMDDLGLLIDHIAHGKLDLPKNEFDPTQIILMGHSRGGGVVLLKAAEDTRIKKVITLAAIHDLSKRWPPSFIADWKEKGVTYVYNGRTEQNMPLYYQLVENFEQNPDRFDIPERVKELNIPVLITHGTEDETLDVAMAYELAALNSKIQLEIIHGANHVFGGSHPFNGDQLPAHTQTVLDKTIAFLREN